MTTLRWFQALNMFLTSYIPRLPTSLSLELWRKIGNLWNICLGQHYVMEINQFINLSLNEWVKLCLMLKIVVRASREPASPRKSVCIEFYELFPFHASEMPCLLIWINFSARKQLTRASPVFPLTLAPFLESSSHVREVSPLLNAADKSCHNSLRSERVTRPLTSDEIPSKLPSDLSVW